jgi:endonuclease/exonuclease/phosphatase family metal-dependent hydrolase
MFRHAFFSEVSLIVFLGAGGLAASPATASASTTIAASHSSKCVGVSGSSVSAGATLVQSTCSGGTEQSFTLVSSGSYYNIRNDLSGLCMKVTQESTSNSAAIVQYVCDSFPAKQFSLVAVSSGVYSIKNVNSGKCLDISGSSSSDGAQLVQYDCNGAASQKFRMSVGAAPTTTTTTTTTITQTTTTTVLQQPSSTPYTTLNVPGRIEAEYFDNGGQGISYSDTTAGNGLGQFRSTDVDIEAASGGGYNIGRIIDGEWLQYTINVATAGTYDVVARVASPYSTGRLDLLLDGALIMDDFSVPNTGGWQVWSNLKKAGVYFSQGKHKLVFKAVVGQFNFDSVEVLAPVAPSGGTVRVFDWNVHKGNRYPDVLTRQVQKMLSYDPDVITLQEVDGWGHQGYYADELKRQSGKTWYYVFATDPISSNNLAAPAVLSRLPFSESNSVVIGCETSGPNRRRNLPRAKISIGGMLFNFFSVHLDYPSNGDTGQCRQQNVENLIKNMNAVSGTHRVAAGDYNASATDGGAQAIVHETLRNSGYADSCLDVHGSYSNCPGTRGSWRIDTGYRSSGIRATGHQVLPADTTLSDHKPVVIDFRY